MIGSRFLLPCFVLLRWQLWFFGRIFEKSIPEAEKLLFMVCLGFVLSVCLQRLAMLFLVQHVQFSCKILVRIFLYTDLYTVALGGMAFSLNCSYLDLSNCRVHFDQTLVGGLSYFGVSLQYFVLSYSLLKK